MDMNRHFEKIKQLHHYYFNNKSQFVLLVFIFTSVTITGCATQPDNLSLPENTVLVPLDLQNMQNKTDQIIRWGGTIVDVKNNNQDTHVTILGYPLDSRARPNTYQNSLNRFIAVFPSFIDPARYIEGREITVIGSIAELRETKIDDYTETYPLVNVSQHHLWLIEVDPIVLDPDDASYYGYNDYDYPYNIVRNKRYYNEIYSNNRHAIDNTPYNGNHYNDGHAKDRHLNDGHVGDGHFKDGDHYIRKPKTRALQHQ